MNEYFSPYHNGWFWEILSKNYLRQISILDTKKRKFRKSKGRIVEATFEIDIKNYLFTDFPLFGAKNWDLSRIHLGYKFSKATNVCQCVRKLMFTSYSYRT